MATLKLTVAITSDDVFPQAVSFSSISEMTIDGDANGIGELEVTTATKSILPVTENDLVAIENRAFVWIRNDGTEGTDANVQVTVGDLADSTGEGVLLVIKPGEQNVLLWDHAQGTAEDILVSTTSGTAYLSYCFCELT